MIDKENRQQIKLKAINLIDALYKVNKCLKELNLDPLQEIKVSRKTQDFFKAGECGSFAVTDYNTAKGEYEHRVIGILIQD